MCISVGTICTKMFVFVPRTSDSVGPENTHHSGCRYHCTADPLFDWFEFDQTSKVPLHIQRLAIEQLGRQVGNSLEYLFLFQSCFCDHNLYLFFSLSTKNNFKLSFGGKMGKNENNNYFRYSDLQTILLNFFKFRFTKN